MKEETTCCTGLVQCYLNIDQPSAAANLAAGLIAKDGNLRKDLQPLQAEAAWQLGQWQELGQLIKVEDGSARSGGWELNLSRVIHAAHALDRTQFNMVPFKWFYILFLDGIIYVDL